MAGEIKKVQFSEGLNVATPADIPFTPDDFAGIMPTTKGGTGVNGSATYPTSGTVATTADITAAFEGKKFKDPVLVATTGNITLSGEQTIDGILTSASRVLVKSQSTTSQNGIYVSAAGAWARASDANTWDELTSAIVAVGRGTNYADTVWLCTLDAGGTLGTDPVTWEQKAGTGAIDLASDVTGILPIGSGGTGSGIASTAFDALSPNANKGDLVSHDGSTNIALPVGTNGQVLVADSAQTTGLKWDDVPAPLTTKGDIYTHNATVADRLPVGANGRVLTANSGAATGLSWEPAAGGGDTSFQIESIAANVATVLGGFIILSDGRELATWDGSTHGSDISVSLLTLLAAPVDGTTYYLYIDINSLGSVQTEGLTGRKLYRVNATNMALSATTPESINRARYVPLSSVVGEAGNTYETGNFRNLSSRRHNNGPLAINPKVYSLSQAVGSVGSASQIKAGHILAAASFPSAMAASKASFFNLAADALDDSANARDLTNNGSTAFTGTNIFGGANLAANLDGANDYFSSTNAHFNPGNGKPWACGGWFKLADWTPSAYVSLMAQWSSNSDRVFNLNIGPSGALEFQATNAASTTDAAITITNPGFTNGTWHHIVALFDYVASSFKVFIDGKLSASTYLANTRAASSPSFTFGKDGGVGAYLDADIEDCFFVNDYLLTDADIRKLYASKLTHGANVAAANQDWKFLLGSGVQKVPSSSPVVDQTDSNTLYADFSDLDASETVDMALLDMGMTAVAVPAVPPFDQTYSSNPSFPISHGLSEVPSLQVGYKDASNDWHWTTGEGAVRADSTQLKGSIQTYFDAGATQVRIRAVVGSSPTGVKEATASAAGIVKGGTVPGKIDGVAVAAGYIGEVVSATPTTQTASGYNSATSCASLSLTAGVWLVTACCSGSMGNRPTGSGAIGLGWDIYNSTAAAIIVSQKYVAYYGNASSDAESVYAPGALSCTVNLVASATLQFRVRCDEAAAGTGTPDTASRAGGLFQAIRIG